MPYFDPTAEADQNLLPSSVRAHAELSNVSAQVESEIIGYYTDVDVYGDALRVRLLGYHATPASAKATLREQLRQTIAEVVGHRLTYYGAETNVKREKRGGREVEYAATGSTQWPAKWHRRLDKFSTVPVGC